METHVSRSFWNYSWENYTGLQLNNRLSIAGTIQVATVRSRSNEFNPETIANVRVGKSGTRRRKNNVILKLKGEPIGLDNYTIQRVDNTLELLYKAGTDRIQWQQKITRFDPSLIQTHLIPHAFYWKFETPILYPGFREPCVVIFGYKWAEGEVFEKGGGVTENFWELRNQRSFKISG